ncbi:MAG TPA: tRNA lysidine(34) synthetase TilS [Terriglobales bacterium]|nr:tRNA lysidine(34) synthetase TilS [Terriglobales bacterium]
MYYGAVPTLAQRVLDYIRRHELLKPGDRVGVAVSGGADSVALLCLLLELRKELGIVACVIHFNHKLRGADSDADEQFVSELARRHKLPFHRESGDVASHAEHKHLSLEAASRELRYAYFHRLLREGVVNRIATAHTLDDQAETVLLRLVRGAGTRGLSGIYPRLSVASSRSSAPHQPSAVSHQEKFAIIRPLLGIRRKALEAYLTALGQSWREDRSNRDLRHARNRVRHGILPRLERNLNPSVREVLAETAEIARQEEDYWQQEIQRCLPQVWATGSPPALSTTALARLPLALQRRVVRAAAESLGLRLEFHHVEEILEVASGAAKSALLPRGWTASRHKQEMRFEPGPATAAGNPDYEYLLRVPGQIEIPQAASRLEALLVPAAAQRGYNPEHLLEPTLLAKELRVRNWRAGDRFWPAHTRTPKKIKELLQQRQVTGPERKLWPVVVSGSEIVWVRGFAVPAKLRPQPGAEQAVVIREVAR